jgi:hypothetical protein
MANLTQVNGSLLYQFPYNAGLINAMKFMIPDTDRRWDANRRAWLVDAKHGKVLAQLTLQFLGEQLHVPTATAVQVQRTTEVLEVRYLGATKDRAGQDERTASGYVGGGWNAVFPESVLRVWFGADETKPEEAATLYAVMGISRVVGAGDIKSAYRKLARQWHPDVCREPDAAEQFKRINAAYQILSDERLRAKYDAGLKLEASLTNQTRRPPTEQLIGWRSPLRCGLILAEGIDRLGRFWVEKILGWEDISRSDGKVLSTSWPTGADHLVESWV